MIRALLLVTVLLTFGCRSELPQPRLLSVTPSSVRAGVPTRVVLHGEAFTRRLQVDLDDPGRSTPQGAFAVELVGGPELEDVRWIDAHRLEATIPASAPVGLQAVRLRDPWGRNAELTDALRVAAECLDAADCDDGLSCTDDACRDGSCQRSPVSDTCLIAGSCYAAGQVQPEGQCQRCDPAVAADGWTDVADGPCDDQSPCTTGDTCVEGSCRGVGVCGDTAPRACLTVSAAAVTAPGAVILDPTCTHDFETPTPALEARFDLDGDGKFDTAFAPLAPATATLTSAGAFRLAVEVRDPGLNLAAASRLVVAVAPGEEVVVTTALDEDDPGATLAEPGGQGLSLREAIGLVNALGAPRTIRFAGPMRIRAAALPALTAAGAQLVGGPGIAIDFAAAGTTAACLQLAGAGQLLAAVELTGCAGDQLALSGAGGRVTDVRLSGAGDDGVVLTGPQSTAGPDVEVSGAASRGVLVRGEAVTVTGVLSTGNGQAGILIGPGGADASVTLSRSWSNAGDGIEIAAQHRRAKIWHNTLDGNAGDGLAINSTAAEVDVRGNLLTGNLRFGSCAPAHVLAEHGFNGYWSNALGAVCAGELGSTSLQADPLYVARGGDFRLRPGSPAIDASTPLGLDLNGPSAGQWSGSVGDLGAVESPH